MKKKYSAIITVDANIVVRFEAEEGLTEQQLKDLAFEHAVCFPSRDEIEIGGLLDCVEVTED